MELSQNLSDIFNNNGSGDKPAPRQGGKTTPLARGEIDAIIAQEGADAVKGVVYGIYGQESSGGTNAVTSVDNAMGGMQIVPDTFKRYAKPGERIDNPADNMRVGVRILKDLGGKFGNDPAKIATGYFSGEGNVNPGQGAAWKQDHADGNGKRVSSYVSDLVARVTGSGSAQAAAGQGKQAGGKPDLGKAPKWADIEAKPEFSALSPEKQAEAKSAYFDYWIAPHAGDKGAEYRKQFLSAKTAKAPEQTGDLASQLEQAKGTPVQGAGMPVEPAVRDAANRAWDAASPEQRKAMESQNGWKGQLARDRASQFMGAQGQGAAGELQAQVDPRAEARAGRLAGAGEDPRFAQVAGQRGAALGATPGKEIAALDGVAQTSEFDFDTSQAFDPNQSANGLNRTLGRGLAKGGLGLAKAVTGYGEFIADVTGMDAAGDKMRDASQWARGKEQAIGERGDFMQRNMEGAISSISQQLPLMITGVAAGSQALALGGLAMQTFGQEYSDGRKQGQNTEQATARAAAFAAFEVVGERFGLSANMNAIKAAARGMPADKILAFVGEALAKEIPGELLTTTGQFSVDKFAPAGMGLNPNATMADYLKQVADTIAQTVMQGGMMAGGTTGVGAAVNHLANRGPSENLQAAQADAARDTALAAWQTNGLTQGLGTPAPTSHPITQEADQIVAELAEAAGLPLETVLPTPVEPPAAAPVPATAVEQDQEPEASVDDQQALAFAKSRMDQLMAKQNGTLETVPGEHGMQDVDNPGQPLSPSEQAELDALQQQGNDPAAVRAMYGLDQQDDLQAEAEAEAQAEREAIQAESGMPVAEQQNDDDIPGFDAPDAAAPQTPTAKVQAAGQESLAALGEEFNRLQQSGEPVDLKQYQKRQYEAVQSAVSANAEALADEIMAGADEAGIRSLQRDIENGRELNLVAVIDQAATPNAGAIMANPDVQAAVLARLPKKPAAPKTEKEARAQKDYGDKWFGSAEKAQAFIAKQGIEASHEVGQDGKKFTIKKKETTNGNQAHQAEQAGAQLPQAGAQGGASQAGAGEEGPGVPAAGTSDVQADGLKAKPGVYVVADAIGADGPEQEKVRLIVLPNGTAAVIRSNDELIDVTNMVRAGFTAERAIAQSIGNDTSGKNVSAQQIVDQADAADRSKDAPGTRYRTEADIKAAERLSLVVDNIHAERASPAGAARTAIKAVVEELSKKKTVTSIEEMLETAAQRLDRTHSALADVVREVVSQIDQRNGQQDELDAEMRGYENKASSDDDTPAARWTRMPTADRAALGLRLGIKPPHAGNMADRAWDRIDPVLQERLAKEMDAPKAESTDLGAMFDDILAEEVAKDEAKQRYEHVKPSAGAPAYLNPAQNAVVDFMNGDITKPELVQKFADLDMSDGEVSSVTDRISSSEFGWTRGDRLDVQSKRPESARRTWSQSDPKQRRELLKAAGYTDGDQARALSVTEWGELTDTVRKALDKPKTEKEAKAQLFEELRAKLSPLADRAMDAGDGKLSGRIRGFTIGMKDTDSNLSRAWVDGVVGDYAKMVERLEKRNAPKTEKESKAKRQAAEAQALADYFRPGNIVKSYTGHDRVVSFTPATKTDGWSVTVRAVQKQGDAWVDVPREGDRTHTTQPEARNLKAGPVGRVEAKAQRETPAQPEQGAVGMKLAAGQVVRTTFGMLTTPFPNLNTETNRKAANTLKAVEGWLMGNALAVAEARGDEFNAGWMRQALNKPSQSDKDSAEEYLFGEMPPVKASILKPLGSAATNTAAALGNAIDGLGALFGGTPGKLNSGMGFDEDTYAKAKPLFQAALANLGDAKADIKEAMRTIVRMVLDKFGAQAAQNMKPYVVRFVSDLQSDTIDTQQEGTQDAEPRANQEPGEPASQQRGPDRSGSGQANQEGLADPSPADGTTAGQPGPDGRPGADSPSQDVGSRGPVRKGGDAADGRAGAGGTRVADDGAGKGAAGNPAADHYAGTNYHIADPEQLIGGTPKVRFARNKKGIEAFNAITSEGREPTKDELDAMAGYIGWGSFGQELFQGTYDRPAPKAGWEKESEWLREHLGKEAWQSAQASIINAHYTDPVTVAAMWDMVRQLGFTGGRIREPSMGVGNFFGLMPRDLMERSKLSGIEMETTTGGMAQLLYPDANIQIKPYQDSKTADDFYDLVIGNWPFAKDGPVDRRYLKLSPSLHDYFFLKALDQTRPGGLVVGITSAGTMDKVGTLTRAALAEKADLVAAFRLPSGAFEKYAGTKVVTDIIILKKRETPNKSVRKSGWLEVKEVPTPSGTPVRINQYFAANPGHILGMLDYGHGTTSMRPGMIVNRPADLEARLNALAKTLPAGVFAPRTTKAKTIQYVTNNTKDREQSMVEKDGELYQVHGEYLAPLADVVNYKVKDEKKTAARVDQIKRLVVMRRAYGALIDAERDGLDDTTAKRAALKKAYDSFVADHGTVNDSDGLAILKRVGDPFYPTLAALEEKGKPSAIMTRQTVRAKKRMDKPSVRDALVMVRNESIDLNMGRVAELAGVPVEKAAKDLTEAGAVYMTPAGNYEVGDVYLSGNVRRKLREAEAAAEQGMDMKANIEALREIQPKDIPYYNIEAKFGATWIRPEQYREFIARLLGVPASDEIEVRWAVNRWKVKFNEATLNRRPEATTTWGHPGIKFDRLLSAAMGNVSVRITYKDADGNTVVDEAQTAEANEKAGKVREEFSTWLWSDPARRIEMERTYNEAMNAIALPKFDGSFLSFEGMALQRGDNPFSLRKHQIDAIWRGLANGRSINAHEVGTGKTYTMGGLAIESRRYGIAKKPIIFAHNANSASVAREIGEMYPGAKLLYIDNLAPDRIAVTLRQIANDDWDAIVVPHSLIDRFALKRETLMEISREQINALEMEAIDAAQEDGANLSVQDMDDEKAMKKVRSSTAKQLVHARNAILKKIEEQAAKSSREDSVSFEDMGIDMVIVDEAHEFKKPPIATRMRMKGLNTATSSQSISMNFLTSYVKKINNGRGVHLFTGTPITNTMTEIFNVMRYVMDDQMARDGLQDWDAWFNTFADSTNDVELTASGEYEPITRLAAFVNTAELRRMIGQYMDIVFADDMPEFKPRPTNTGKTLTDTLTDKERDELLNGRNESPVGRPYKRVVTDTAEMTAAQKTILATLQERSNIFKRASKKDRKEMMMSGSPNSPVIVETDASNAGLDARLFDISANDEPTSKVNRAVTRLVHHYNEHPLATQVVFVERGFTSESVSRKKDKVTGQVTVTKKARFNLIEELIDKLVAQGIKRDEIAVVDGSTSKEKRKLIADAMNRAEIRVVIGNTKTLGVGVNMQANLRAMHHLDAPWMPGDLEQRNGRGHRQGNKWNTVMEYRYLTERIDGRRWQVLAVKDRFIKAFLKADEAVRVIDGDAVSMDEEGDLGSTLADAAGDPRLLMMNKLRADVGKLEGKERMHSQAIYDAGQMAKQLERDIKTEGQQAERAQRDNEFFREQVKAGIKLEINGQVITEAEPANEALARAVQMKLTEPSRDSVELGTAWGFTIEAYWPTKFSDVQYSVTRSGGLEYPIGKATIESVRATLYGIKERIAKYEARIAEKTTSLPRMVEATKAPFARADELAKKRKMFSDIEADIQLNPIPAPAWLRNGAPTNTAVFVDGKPAVVEGHRWTPDGYMVTLTEGDTTKDVDYLEVKDVNGLPIYEVHPFTSPVVTSADGTKTAQGEQKAKPGDVKFNQQDDQDGYTGPHETGQPDNTPDTQAAIQALERRFASDFGNAHPVQGWSTPSIEAVLPIGEAFGARIVGFKVNGAAGSQGVVGKIRDSNGFYFKGSVFLNASSDRPHLAVLGHEIAHRLKKTRPDLYAKLVNAIRPYVKGKEYGSTFATSAVAKDSYPAGATVQERDAAIQEEFVGEVLSDGFMDPAFWQALGKANKELLARVQLFVAKIINKVLSATGYKKRTEQYLSDYAKVMEIAGQVMAEYGLNQGNLNQAAGLPKFEVTDKATEASADTPDIRFNTQDDPAQQGLVRKVQNNLIQFFGNRGPSLKTFNWFDKSLSTQYNKALKDRHFGKVFALASAMQNHVSLAALRAAELAPGVLPRVDNIKAATRTLFKGKANARPIEAAARAIFAGTLHGATVLDGKVWSEADLRDKFGLDDTGVAMYQQTRDAINASLDEVAAAEAFAMAQTVVPKAMRRDIIDHPQAAEGLLLLEMEGQIKTAGLALKAARKAGDDQRAAEMEAVKEAFITTKRNVELIFNTVKNLKKAGYAPLMRFGKFYVEARVIDPNTGNTVRDDDGKAMIEFYGRYETEGEAMAVRVRLEAQFEGQEDIRISAGPSSQSAHELYGGISPETMALFAEALGVEPVMRKYIEEAMSERSALKRRLHRSGTAGYSDDMPRVLSSFITSNSRHASQRLYMRELNQAIKFIPHEKGDVKDEAVALKKFITDPNDGGAGWSSVLFAWFLGGSVASAVVNLTQPFLMTGPYLSQHGFDLASKAMAKALPMAMGKKEISDPSLREAMKRASQEGIVDAQEIFHLYNLGAQGVASGLVSTMARLPVVGDKLKAGSEGARARVNAFMTLWGSMFSLAEGFNRRLTFIAAWDVAKAKGLTNAQAYSFSVRAVNKTQGVYNKVNRPNWARSSVGRVILTFKQFSIMYVELLTRMVKHGGPEGRRAALVMLSVLMLAGGEEGLPFMQDLNDLIDTIGQGLFKLDTNTVRSKRRWAHETLGKELGDLFLYGLSSQLPIDFSGRLGLGNLIPGTGLLKPSDESQRGRQIGEVLGAAAGLGGQVGDAFDAAVEGNSGKAWANLAPKAIKDVLAAVEMASKGYATDPKGNKVVETTGLDAVSKGIGFNPTKVAQEHRKTMPVQQDIALQKRTEASIVAQWARAVVDDKPLDEVQKRLDDWNTDNPDTPISIKPTQIRDRVRQMNTEKDGRILKMAPKEMRGRAGLDLVDPGEE